MLLIVMYEVTTILAYCPNPGTKQHNGAVQRLQTNLAFNTTQNRQSAATALLAVVRTHDLG
jgi:hypothetical protein